MNSVKITEKFESLFNCKPLLVNSPGRVNLIGEHTDYNNGFVLPAAIDKSIILAIGKAKDNISCLHADDMNESYEFNLNDFQKSGRGWPDYLLGVVDQFLKTGYKLDGFNCVFGGDIPIGAGLSSSAAIEGGLAFALNELFGLGIDRLELVKMAQKAENEFVGVKCGIMDQFINIFGEKNKVMKIDCRSLKYEYFPIKLDSLKIVLLDTQIKHSLASSEYNLRREQCEEGVALLKKYNPDIDSLRDVNIETLESVKGEMDETIYKRCDFVLNENERVVEGCRDLNKNDVISFGKKMFESHYGLRDNYEVSCKELDLLVSIAEEHSGVIGARMMGGGFGGCAINLIKERMVEDFINRANKIYKDETGKELKSYICSIEGGTSLIN